MAANRTGSWGRKFLPLFRGPRQLITLPVSLPEPGCSQPARASKTIGVKPTAVPLNFEPARVLAVAVAMRADQAVAKGQAKIVVQTDSAVISVLFAEDFG